MTNYCIIGNSNLNRSQQFLNFLTDVVGLTTDIPQAKRKSRGGLLEDLKKNYVGDIKILNSLETKKGNA